MVSLELVLLALGALATFTGGYFSRVGVWRYMRPVIKHNSELYTKSRTGVPREVKQSNTPGGEFKPVTRHTVYQVEVENTGRTAAENCKASLVLDGVVELPIEDREERFELYLRAPLRWDEPDRPGVTDLNPNQTLAVEILRETRKPFPVPEVELNSIYVVEIPAEDEPISRVFQGDERFEPPHFDITPLDREEVPAALHNMNWTPSQFGDVDWESSYIEITGDRSDSYRVPIEVDGKDGGLCMIVN